MYDLSFPNKGFTWLDHSEVFKHSNKLQPLESNSMSTIQVVDETIFAIHDQSPPNKGFTCMDRALVVRIQQLPSTTRIQHHEHDVGPKQDLFRNV